MPSLDLALQQQAQARIAEEEFEKSKKAEQEKADIAVIYGRLSRLSANQDVDWFLKTFIQPLVDTEHAAALDVKGKTAQEQREHAQRWNIAVEIRDLLKHQNAIYQNKIQALA
jgi:hypothetical protein